MAESNVTDDYMAHRSNAATSAESSEMESWLNSKDAAQAKPTGDVQAVPFPTGSGKRPSLFGDKVSDQTLSSLVTGKTNESTAGKVMRNVAEIPKGVFAGLESAVYNATSWADPFTNWLNDHVADLRYDATQVNTPTGQVTKSLSEFLTGYIPALKGLKAVGIAKVAAPIAAAAVADFTVRDPHEARLSNLWQQLGLPKNALTDYLAADPKDGYVEGRFKSAAESVLTGLGLEGLIQGAKGLQLSKWAGKLIGEGKQAETDSLRAQYGELTDQEVKATLGDSKRPSVEPVNPPSSTATADKSGQKWDVSTKTEMMGANKDTPSHMVQVKDPEGKVVAYADFAEQDGKISAQNVHVDEAVRGKGLAEMMYRNALGTTGKEIIPSANQTPAGAKMVAALQDKGVISGAEPKATADEIIGGRGVVKAGDQSLYINFARIEGENGVKDAIATMAEKYAPMVDEARRGSISQAATKMMANDLGMTVPDLLARRAGQPLNAEEALAARGLWAASADNLVETAKAAASPNASPLEQFAFRRAMATHAAIQAEVIGARTETARALASWKIPAGGGIEKARAIQQMMDASGGNGVSQELARRLKILADNGAPASAIGQMAAKGWGATSFDALREVWVNGLLSNPPTHLVNSASNMAVAFQSILERGVASRIGNLRGAGDGVAPGEAMALTYGLVSGVRDAFRMSWQALKTGETGASLGKIDLPHQGAFSAEAFGMSNSGAAGRAVDFLGNVFRVPSRLLGAEDEFFKSIAYRMEVHAQSLRQATSEGLAGEPLGRRMAELVNNPPENIRIAAADQALYNTFTQQTGDVGKAFTQLRERVPAVSFVLPFIKTPANIARYTFERTPFAPLVQQWREDIAAGGARADLALARMSVGSTIMLSALDWADSGTISGKGPKETGTREAMSRQGWQPYSVKVGDRWYSYNRMDPFGAMLGFSADVAEAVKDGELNEDHVDEWNEVVATGVAAVAQEAINKQYLRGLSDFFNTMADPARKSEKYIESLFSSFLPYTALSGGIERAVDPVQREVHNPWEAMKSKIAGLASELPPRLDLWGKAIRSDESELGKAYDFFSPVQARKIKPEPIDTEIMRLSPLAAQDNVPGSAPSRIGMRSVFQGVSINFKDWPEVYTDYVRMAGNDLKSPAFGLGAKDFLNSVVTGKSQLAQVYQIRSDEMKIRFINETVQMYRKQAQNEIMTDPKYANFANYVQALKEHAAQVKLPVTQ